MGRIEKEWVEFPQGSDVSLELPFQDDNGVAINMTGWTIEIFKAGPEGTVEAYVNANATVAWTNQSGGIAQFDLPWDDAAPPDFWVRLRITRTADGHDDGIDQMNVRYT